MSYLFFFFNDTATTEIYTLSLHDALPICLISRRQFEQFFQGTRRRIDVRVPISCFRETLGNRDRKSTRLNSSHTVISYAVFCLKKKKYSSEVSAASRMRCAKTAQMVIGCG